jgi:CubicO group peptidase (beta-lactamase class C family)
MLLRALITLLAIAGATYAQEANDFDNFIRPYAASNNFSGNVLIEHHGEIVFQRSYGYLDREHKRCN